MVVEEVVAGVESVVQVAHVVGIGHVIAVVAVVAKATQRNGGKKGRNGDD